MSKFPFGCNPVGKTGQVTHTIENVGAGADWFVVGTGPNPFQFRSAISSDGTVDITENATEVDFIVDFSANVANLNVGGFAEWFRTGTLNPFEFRTLQSSDGSVSVTENALDIDITVPVGAATPVFQVDSTATLLTNSDSFLTLVTLAGDAKVVDGAIWKINMCVLVCVPHALGSTSTNAETRWLIETASGVFTEFDRYSSRDQITIFGSEKSSPMHRTKELTVQFDAPRMRVEVRRTTSGSANFFWEDARWGGVRITAAP